jgi:hypothetical protein
VATQKNKNIFVATQKNKNIFAATVYIITCEATQKIKNKKKQMGDT